MAEAVKKNGPQKVTTDKEIAIVVNALTVWTPEVKSWYRRKPTKPKLTILDNVSVTVKGGEFVAILGPSGAGKTTFLVSLAGKCTLPCSGTVAVNDVAVDRLPDGFLEIVPQVEVFMTSLSVSEHLRFMTEMKLGRCDRVENQSRMDTLMSSLMLVNHADTTISALSGGERRLLSLASSLLSSPRVVVLDEPTTGLDSYNALIVVNSLKRLADTGILVICSIHQPSSIVFKEFNSIMLMAEGQLLFHGSQGQCWDLFETIGLHCPLNYNPAEFYIKAISNDPSVKLNHADQIQRSFQNRVALENYSVAIPTVPPKATFKVYKRHWLKQVSLLLWRSSLSLKRQMGAEIIKLIFSLVSSSIQCNALRQLISATVIGACYVGISGTTQRGIQDVQGLLWVLCSEVCYAMAYNSLFAFDKDMTLFRREQRLYSASAFFAARFCCYIPHCVVYPVTFVSIATAAVNLPNHVLTTLKFMAALVYTSIGAVAYGLGMGAWITSTSVTGEVISIVDLPLYVVAGFFMSLASIPTWLYAFKYISHFRYSFDALANIYWRQIDTIECPSNSTQTCVREGATFLSESGYSSNFILEDGLGILLVFAFWCLIGYLGVKREERKGYVY